jgi:hypothetical protein
VDGLNKEYVVPLEWASFARALVGGNVPMALQALYLKDRDEVGNMDNQ